MPDKSNQNSKKRKYGLIGLGAFLATSAITLSITLPLVLLNNNGKVPPPFVKETEKKIETSLVYANADQVQIKVSNLEKYIQQWLFIEYQVENHDSSVTPLKRSFFVNSATEYVLIGGLNPGIKYQYLVKTEENNALTEKATFLTFSKPEITRNSGKTWIEFKFSDLKEEYLGKEMVVRYRKYKNGWDANATETKEVSVVVVQKKDSSGNPVLDSDGKFIYEIIGKVEDLDPSTPYIFSLHLKGEESGITDPIIFWTKGDQPADLIITDPIGTKGLEIQIPDLDNSDDTTGENNNFVLKYWKKSESQANAQTKTLGENENSVNVADLPNLESNGEYFVQLFRLENGVEVPVGNSVNFRAPTRPYVKEKTFNNIATKWRKSGANGLLVLAGLVDVNDSNKSINHSDLQVAAIEVASFQLVPSFKVSSPILANVEAASSNFPDEYTVKLAGLTPGKKYAIQVFNKADTNFENPLLKDTFIEATTPKLFNSEILGITPTLAKIKISNINNYKSKEIKLVYWQKEAPNNISNIILEFNEGQSEISIELSPLLNSKDYQFTIKPVYSELNTEADNLIAISPEFSTSAVLTASGVDGDVFSNSIKFKLLGVDNSLPINQPLALQWRVKDGNSRVNWEPLNSSNSYNFSIVSPPINGQFLIDVPNNNSVIWQSETAYEWRIIEKSVPNTNLIKRGTTEFILKDHKISKIFNSKITPLGVSTIKWRAPMVENIVASGLGNAAGITMWRQFFGLTEKSQWQHYLEWLTFQSVEIQKKAIDNIVRGFTDYPPLSSNKNLPADVYWDRRFTAVPYLPKTNEEIAKFILPTTSDDVKFGGYNHDQFSDDNPIKPSDFMKDNNRFQNSPKYLEKAIQYYLQEAKKDVVHPNKPSGISRNNIFGDGMSLSRSETYASYINSKAKLNSQFAISSSDPAWTIELWENNGATEIFANDLNGELFFQVKATKGNETHRYWTKINGFKKADSNSNIEKNNLSFELYTDHTKSAIIIFDELSKLTSPIAKKTLIEKYYKVRLSSSFADGWTLKSVSLAENKKSLDLVVELPVKKFAKGSFSNPNEKLSLGTAREFQYNLKTFDLDNLSNPKLLIPNQTGTLTKDKSGINDNVHFMQISWTYEQMLNKMRDAYLTTTKITNLAEQIVTGMKLMNHWTNKQNKLYFRTIGQPLLDQWGNEIVNPENYKILESNLNGFLTLHNLAIDNGDVTKRITEMIVNYGSKPTLTS